MDLHTISGMMDGWLDHGWVVGTQGLLQEGCPVGFCSVGLVYGEVGRNVGVFTIVK